MNKDPSYCCPQRMRPIIPFDIEANIHNKHLGRIAMIQSETLDRIAPEKYGICKEKSADIQALNTRLF